MTLKAPIKARTWGLIAQPHTVMRPIRHRRPSLIPGAHQVSRKGDGSEYGRGVEWVDKLREKFLREVSAFKGLRGGWSAFDPRSVSSALPLTLTSPAGFPLLSQRPGVRCPFIVPPARRIRFANRLLTPVRTGARGTEVLALCRDVTEWIPDIPSSLRSKVNSGMTKWRGGAHMSEMTKRRGGASFGHHADQPALHP